MERKLCKNIEIKINLFVNTFVCFPNLPGTKKCNLYSILITDEWLELCGHFFIGPNLSESHFSTTSKTIIPPRHFYDWNFLGKENPLVFY